MYDSFCRKKDRRMADLRRIYADIKEEERCEQLRAGINMEFTGMDLHYKKKRLEQAVHDKLKRTIIILNDKLIKFLTNIYLGPIFEEDESTKITTLEPVQSRLMFLDPNDPYYKVTTIFMLNIILCDIYPKANDLMRVIRKEEYGSRPADEAKEYFLDEYNKVLNKYLDHQEKYEEVEGDYRRFKFNGNKYPHLRSRGIPRQGSVVWIIPREYSLDLVKAMWMNNVEKYQIDDEKLDDWIEEHVSLLKKLNHSNGEMDDHPEVQAGAISVKVAGRKTK